VFSGNESDPAKPHEAGTPRGRYGKPWRRAGVFQVAESIVTAVCRPPLTSRSRFQCAEGRQDAHRPVVPRPRTVAGVRSDEDGRAADRVTLARDDRVVARASAAAARAADEELFALPGPRPGVRERRVRPAAPHCLGHPLQMNNLGQREYAAPSARPLASARSSSTAYGIRVRRCRCRRVRRCMSSANGSVIPWLR
jgi:hypothetical protein